MEITTTFHSFSNWKLPYPPLKLNYGNLSPSFSVYPQHSTATHVLGFQRKLVHVDRSREQLRYFRAAINASNAKSNSHDDVQKWLLEPIGDGSTKHIGFKTKMPGAFEVASRVVTVGRVPGKADIVLPVPTVSGVHARIQKTEESLVVTDLDSTNGTFIDEKRLIPGIAAIASPGSKIIFGDTNLAIFRVSKMDSVVVTNDTAIEVQAEDKPDDT